MSPTPEKVYENLSLLEKVDIVKSALYRQLAQEILANPKVSLKWKEKIAERLYQANNRLTLASVGENDSY